VIRYVLRKDPSFQASGLLHLKRAGRMPNSNGWGAAPSVAATNESNCIAV
jgi:hypothetical protein